MKQSQFLLIAKAISDPTRHRVIRALSTSDGACCADLHACAGVSKATLSHHLRILERAGLIRVERRGQFHRVTLEARTLRAFARAAADPGAFTDENIRKPRAGKRLGAARPRVRTRKR